MPRSDYDDIERSSAWRWLKPILEKRLADARKEEHSALMPGGAGADVARIWAGIVEQAIWTLNLPARGRAADEREATSARRTGE